MNDILFGNSNRPVIKKLSNRYFKAGKSRNIIAIIAIALTTIFSKSLSFKIFNPTDSLKL